MTSATLAYILITTSRQLPLTPVHTIRAVLAHG